MPNHHKESDPAPAHEGAAHEDEDSDDIPSNPSTAPPLSALIDMRRACGIPCSPAFSPGCGSR